jgi:gamma-glutamylcyclotransferase (GGCT)/AIG2-like uncharacterized protein YtfP
MLYFAYGSNMSRQSVLRLCPAARDLGAAILLHHRFVIMTNGYASVVAAQGETVHGLLWNLSPRDIEALDAYEDVAGGLYRHASLPVMHGGAMREALVYVGCDAREGHPRPGYIELVTAAARECGLPEDYVATLTRFSPGAD